MIRVLIADPDSATRKALILLLQRKLSTPCIYEVNDVEMLIRTLAETLRTRPAAEWLSPCAERGSQSTRSSRRSGFRYAPAPGGQR